MPPYLSYVEAYDDHVSRDLTDELDPWVQRAVVLFLILIFIASSLHAASLQHLVLPICRSDYID